MRDRRRWVDVPDGLLGAWREAFGTEGGAHLRAPCPVCGQSTLHRFYGAPHPTRRIGALWQWCSTCCSYLHASALVPDDWVQPFEVDEYWLTHEPELLQQALEPGAPASWKPVPRSGPIENVAVMAKGGVQLKAWTQAPCTLPVGAQEERMLTAGDEPRSAATRVVEALVPLGGVGAYALVGLSFQPGAGAGLRLGWSTAEVGPPFERSLARSLDGARMPSARCAAVQCGLPTACAGALVESAAGTLEGRLPQGNVRLVAAAHGGSGPSPWLFGRVTEVAARMLLLPWRRRSLMSAWARATEAPLCHDRSADPVARWLKRTRRVSQ